MRSSPTSLCLRSSAVLAAAALALAAAGCAPAKPAETGPQGQTFTEAMTLICNVDALAGLAPEDDPISIGQKRTAWITEKADNPDAIYLRTMLSVAPASEQATALREQAKIVGMGNCALADAVEKDGGGGLSP